MISGKKTAYLGLVIRLWIGGIFFFSGWLKAVEPYENFRGILAQYELLPPVLAPLIAQTIPWVELILGLFLITGYVLPAAALGAALLSGAFAVLIGFSLASGAALPADCGCFGSGIHFKPAQMLVLDIIHSALAVFLFRSRPSWLTLDALFVRQKPH